MISGSNYWLQDMLDGVDDDDDESDEEDDEETPKKVMDFQLSLI